MLKKKGELKMRKLFLILFIVFDIYAANVFIDGGLGTGSNDGTTTDNAYQSLATALATNKTAPNYYWIRRRNSISTASNITTAVTGGYESANTFYAIWPRDSLIGTGNFIQGQRVISNSSVSANIPFHVTRHIYNTADSNRYMITAIAQKIIISTMTGTPARYDNVRGITSTATGKIMRYADGGTIDTVWIVARTGTFQELERFTKATTAYAQDSASWKSTIDSVDIDNGFVIDNLYSGSTSSGATWNIERDPLWDIARTIDDGAWTIKKTDWDADPDSLITITFTSTGRLNFTGDWSTLQGFIITGGGGGSYGNILINGMGNALTHCINYQSTAGDGVQLSLAGNGGIYNCVFIGTGGSSSYDPIKSNNPLCKLTNVAVYGAPRYGINFAYGGFVENVNSGIEIDNASNDLQLQVGIVKGTDLACGGRNGSLRSSTYDAYSERYDIENYNKIYGLNYSKIGNGALEQKPVSVSSDPVKRSGGSDYVVKFTQSEDARYACRRDVNAKVLYERNVYFSTASGSDTIRCYIQNNGYGNINAIDSVDTGIVWIEAYYPKQYINDTIYKIGKGNNCQVNNIRGTSSSNPIGNRSSSSDWSKYLQVILNVKKVGNIKIKVMSARAYSASGIIYIDPKLEIKHGL